MKMNDNVEIIKSNKGGMKIIHRGYMYTVHKKRQGGRIRWRCTQRSLHCKGSISTGNGSPTVNMPHNHIPDPHSVALARCRQLEEYPDVNSLLETQYDENKDSRPSTSNDNSECTRSESPTKSKVPKTKNEEEPNSPSEEVCLRWNSHHSNMQSVFPELLVKERYVDVTLMAEGKALKCHKIILSSCSSYFEEILDGINPMQHPVVILKGVEFWILKLLTDFMYVGEISIDQNKLPELLEVAEMLKVKGLTRKSTPKTPVSEPNSSYLPQTATKVDDENACLINDPQQLLEPKYKEEDNDVPDVITESSTSQSKLKVIPKKVAVRKIRKRKSVEPESSPTPMFPMRRGTRSRPNVKVPKYYDYEDVVKSTTTTIATPRSSAETSFSSKESSSIPSIVRVKPEPIDFEVNEMTFYSEELKEKDDDTFFQPTVDQGDTNMTPIGGFGIETLKSLQKVLDITPIVNNEQFFSSLHEEQVGNVVAADVTSDAQAIGVKESDCGGGGSSEKTSESE